jgi:PHP family Zn ribbon phosphoesterase
MKTHVVDSFVYMSLETSFERTLENDNQHIRSACKQCGAIIVCGVMHGLAELEASHLARCKKPNTSLHIVPANKFNQSK